MVLKHSLSKEDVIEDLKERNDFLKRELIEMAEENKRLKNKKWWHIWKK